MTEVRRVAWPAYETPEWSAAQFLQGIAGTLELFHRSSHYSRTLVTRAASDVCGPLAIVCEPCSRHRRYSVTRLVE